MDIAKYIGLFLIKNEQCYVNGLGTLQIVRKPATYNEQYLHAGSTEINIVPGGNVDESLANYIATNEQISITKAVAAVKEYSAETKNRLLAGEMIALPFLGKLMAEDGRIGFITDDHLQFQGPKIAAKKGVTVKEQERPPIPHQPFIPSTPVGAATPPPSPSTPPAMPKVAPAPPPPPQHEPQGDRINWARLIFVILLLIILAAGAYYAYMRFLSPQKARPKASTSRPALTIPDEIEDFPEEEEVAPLMDSAAIDNMAKDTAKTVTEPVKQEPTQPTTQPVKAPEKNEPKTTTNSQPVEDTPPPPTNSSNKIKIKVVVNTFDSKSEAYKRKNQLISSGVKADVIEEDVNYYFVVIPVQADPADTSQLLRNMTNKYNKDGVFVY